jgi:hypothetical protein
LALVIAVIAAPSTGRASTQATQIRWGATAPPSCTISASVVVNAASFVTSSARTCGELQRSTRSLRHPDPEYPPVPTVPGCSRRQHPGRKLLVFSLAVAERRCSV